MTHEKLLPCPFGGQNVRLVHDTSSDYERHWSYFVESDLCEGLRYSNPQDAIKAWNTRAKPDPRDEQIRILREGLEFVKYEMSFIRKQIPKMQNFIDDTLNPRIDLALAAADKLNQQGGK